MRCRPQIGSPDAVRLPATDADRARWAEAEAVGEQALSAGEVAAVVVAGGQGTRLGFDAPKGTYPIGSMSGASLFQIHVQKIVALGRRYGRPIPLYVMTSPDNHAETQAFLDQHDGLRLRPRAALPAGHDAGRRPRDREDPARRPRPPGAEPRRARRHAARAGRARRPAAAPAASTRCAADGVSTIFYFQVDNPLTQIADPAFIGFHRQAEAEVSFKVVEKVAPEERVGVVVRTGDRHAVIEYSDLPDELA